jgi:hypothetical protein
MKDVKFQIEILFVNFRNVLDGVNSCLESYGLSWVTHLVHLPDTHLMWLLETR